MTPEIAVGKNGLPRHVRADKQRDGSPRYRLRRPGHPVVTLPAPALSKAFWDAYNAAIAGKVVATALDTKSERPQVRRVIEGTFRATCLRYFAECVEFEGLDEQTRRVRKRIFESMWLEPTKPGSDLLFDNCPIKTLSIGHVRLLRDRKRATPEAANSRLKALSKFFEWCIEEQIFEQNYARDVKRLASSGDGHHAWSVEEIERYRARHPIGTKAGLALAIFCFAGLRISDAAILGRQHIRNGEICLRLAKNKKRAPVDVVLPVLPELRSAIAAGPCGDLTLLVTEYGKAFTAKGLGNKMRQWCDEAALPHCSAHGIRKASATLAAENGATERQLMAIFGWKDPEMAALYTRKASQKRLAADAMHTLSSGQDRNEIDPQSQAVPSRGTKTT